MQHRKFQPRTAASNGKSGKRRHKLPACPELAGFFHHKNILKMNPRPPFPSGIRGEKQGKADRLASLFGDGSAMLEVGFELADPDDITRASAVLHGLANVVAVSPPAPHSDAWRLAVRPAAAEGEVRQAVLAAAVEHGLRLTALRPIVPSLDDIYRTALQRRASADHRPAADPAGTAA
jgi:hypothetical protein